MNGEADVCEARRKPGEHDAHGKANSPAEDHKPVEGKQRRRGLDSWGPSGGGGGLFEDLSDIVRVMQRSAQKLQPCGRRDARTPYYLSQVSTRAVNRDL